MKKVIYPIAILLIAMNFSSCNPESIIDQAEPQACCDGNGEIDPPPPPPDLIDPSTGNGG